MTDIEKSKSLLSLNSYLKNNLKEDKISVQQNITLHSDNLDKIEDFDVSCISYYDYYLKQD